ncbi:MAG: hypothetical protein ACYC4Q_02120 [Victivallaceae bacterium]
MRVLILVAVFAAMAWGAAFAAEPKFNTGKYAEVSIQDVHMSPEKYNTRNICLKTTFHLLTSDYFRFAAKSGLTPDRYYCMRIEPASLPAFVLKKKADLILPQMKGMTPVTVYGRLLKFSSNSRWTQRYYLLVERVETDAKPDEKPVADTGKAKKANNQKAEDKMEKSEVGSPDAE